MTRGGARPGSGRTSLGDDGLRATIPATRVTEGERQLLEEAAAREGVSMAVALRRAMAQWVRKVLK